MREAVKLVRAGVIGDVYMWRGLVYKWRDTIGRTPASAVPDGVDYDLWTGPERGFRAHLGNALLDCFLSDQNLDDVTLRLEAQGRPVGDTDLDELTDRGVPRAAGSDQHFLLDLRVVGNEVEQRIVRAIDRIRARDDRWLLAAMLRHVRQVALGDLDARLVALDLDVADPGDLAMNARAAELLLGDVLIGHRLDQRRPAERHRALARDHRDEVGQPRDVRGPGRAGADHRGDLRHDAAIGGLRVLYEDDALLVKARTLWAEVYPRLSEGYPGLLGAMTSRAEAQVMRVACIYALLDRSKVVQMQHLRAALAVWRYCEASARFLFGDSLGDPTADALLHLFRSKPEGVTRTDIYHFFDGNKASEDIGRALMTLQEHGLARMERVKNDQAKRPTEKWLPVSPLKPETERVPYARI